MNDLIDRLHATDIADHPFLQRVGSEQPDMSDFQALLANAREFARRLVRWYALLIARLHDARLQSLLARQLNDELGGGDPSQIHIDGYDALLAALRPFERAGDRSPGERFASSMDACYTAADADEAVGTVIAAEVRGWQMNQWIGMTLQRQQALPLEQLDWYHVHAEVEQEHAQDSAALYALLDSDARRDAAARGAAAFDQVLWRFLDEMQTACVNGATPG